MIYNSGDESHVTRASKKIDRFVELEKAQIRKAWSNPFCRAELYGVIQKSFVLGRTFVAGQQDVSAYNQGARELGLQLYERVMGECPELFNLAAAEAAGQPQEEEETE